MAVRTCTSTVQIWINVSNFPLTLRNCLAPFANLYRWCTNVYAIFHDCSIRVLWCNMAVLPYIDCTIFNWGEQCFPNHFNPFDCQLYPAIAVRAFTSIVQIWIDFSNVSCNVVIHLVPILILYSWCTDVSQFYMTALLEKDDAIYYSYGCTPVHRLYKSELTSPMFHTPLSILLPFVSLTCDVRKYSQV